MQNRRSSSTLGIEAGLASAAAVSTAMVDPTTIGRLPVEIAIRSRHVRVPKSVRTMTEEKIARLERYLGSLDHAEVAFKEERNPRIAEKEICEITLSGHGHTVRARAASTDQLSAVDEAVTKLKHQMEKLKVKLVIRPHSHNGHDKTLRKVRVAKRKQFVVDAMTVDEAIAQMEQVDHDFFLFTNAATGESAVVYRRDDGAVGLIDAAS